MPKKGWLFFCALLISIQCFAISKSFPKTDSVITAQVEIKIAENKILAPANLQIQTHNAIVTVTGTLDNPEELAIVVRIVLAVAGVNGIDVSRVLVLRGQFNFDDLITSQIQGLYVREGIIDPQNFDSSNIHILTKDGRVYLSGSVKDNKTAADAEKFAKMVPGVTGLTSSLKVDR